ncbi:carbonic anhydrase 15-like [Bombina bombina]|uniref:carbonic anhydrase 15-like n=1 Tax=Bombina bombina TaxID=8345 RepID=UPI00235ADC63|nr:carbonic anhydrase 15-like [Bombina bombina]
MAEYAYNNLKNSSTNLSPFYASYGYHPTFHVNPEASSASPQLEDYTRNLITAFANITMNIQKAQENQKHYYDLRRRTPPKYAIGDKVWLSTKNLRLQVPSKKLASRFIGPFSVIRIINENAVTLELPPTIKVHPTLHVSLLKPYRPTRDTDLVLPPSLPLVDTESYEVHSVLDSRFRGSVLEYLIQNKDRVKMYLLLVTFLILPLVVQASGGGHWCYSSQNPKCGPDHWKEFNHNCGGNSQSPINILRPTVKRDNQLGNIVFQGYDRVLPGRWRLMNDGHSVQMSLEGEPILGHINISGAGLPNKFLALQFHFHWGSPTRDGSEHTMDGKQYPMELHIVHINAKYRSIAEAKKDPQGLAVLGILFTVGKNDNPYYNTLVTAMKNVTLEGNYIDLASTFPLETLLPPREQLSKYYRYQGSLTTPDCSEAVIWTVFEHPVTISQEQLRVFTDTAHFTAQGETLLKIRDNFRPPQPLKGRLVWASQNATVNHSNTICFSVFTLHLSLTTYSLLYL